MYEGLSVLLSLERVLSLVSSHWVEKGRGGVSIVGTAAVADQSDIDEEESYKGICLRFAPEAAKDGGAIRRRHGGG